ncbi:MAG: 2Fe-2S iron-sulfur cluster-binding protein [bacterium]|nr:2Fe-2S iron-sulfur cluster-binding protein [bacterium]
MDEISEGIIPVVESHYKVTFEPEGRAVSVLSETTILEAAAGAGFVIDMPCGGAGTCGKCRVQVTQGVDNPTEVDKTIFSDEDKRYAPGPMPVNGY